MKISKRGAVLAVAAMTLASLGYGVAVAVGPTPSSPNVRPGLPTGDQRKLAAVSSGTAESTYVPLKACRIVDTRSGGGRIGNGSTRNFTVGGTAGFPAQGGKSGGCGVPTFATAVTARLAAYKPAAAGSFAAFATGAPTGLGTLFYNKNQTITTGTTVPLGTGAKISVKNVGGPSHAIIDIAGYYVPQIQATLASSGGIYASNSDRVLSSTRLGTGAYRVQIAGSLTGCTPIASIDGSAYFASSYVSGSYVYANTYNPSGTPTDLYWTLVVLC